MVDGLRGGSFVICGVGFWGSGGVSCGFSFVSCVSASGGVVSGMLLWGMLLWWSPGCTVSTVKIEGMLDGY